MNIWVFSICKDQGWMMPWFLRHYGSFASKIIIWDEQSTDGTREMIQCCPLAELREWTGRGLNDEEFLRAINTFYKEARGKADWVMWPDTDELLYHPDIRWVIRNAREDMILSKGYALISPTGLPDGDGQVYELIRTGTRQPNYDKFICWRPTLDVIHTIGRHTYPGRFPRCSGILGTVPRMKLLHCHHLGGVNHTALINRQNYDRAANKRYAWNYTDHHNLPTQCGTVAWVQNLIHNGALFDVIADSL